MKERLGAGGLVGGGGVAVSTGGLRGGDGGALVGDVGDESVDVVSGVLGGLDPAVGQGDHIAAGNNAVSVLSLCLLEVGLAVVVVDSILVGERLGGELLFLVDNRRGGTVSGGASGEGDSHKGRGNGNLKKTIYQMLMCLQRVLGHRGKKGLCRIATQGSKENCLNIICLVIPENKVETESYTKKMS